MLRATSIFRGCTIQARDGKAGHVSDVLFDGSSWKVRWLVIDTGSWASERLVLIHPSAVGESDGSIDRVYVELTREQIGKSADIFQDPPVSRQLDRDFAGGDGAAAFWEDQDMTTGSASYPFVVPPLFAQPAGGDRSPSLSRVADQDPNLRSAREVSGYHVRAVDGDIGHLLEFLIDDEAWMIRYLIVDTTIWLPGPHVMLAPPTVVEIDFWTRRLRLNVTRDQVSHSPPAWKAEPTRAYD